MFVTFHKILISPSSIKGIYDCYNKFRFCSALAAIKIPLAASCLEDIRIHGSKDQGLSQGIFLET